MNPKNPLIVGPVLTVDSLAASFMPAYLILEAARVGRFSAEEESTVTNMVSGTRAGGDIAP